MKRFEISFDPMEAMQNAFYQQVDPRRRQEISDSRMVREDQNAMANLPRQAIHHEYDQNRFKHDALSAGSPDWGYNNVGFIRQNQKGFYGKGSE